MNLHIASGCNSYYFRYWLCLYESIQKHIPSAIIHFFDFGLTEYEINIVNSLNVIYSKFKFELYEPWVNINNNSGQWAWKAQCIKSVVDNININTSTDVYVAWFDSRNIVYNNLHNILSFCKIHGIYTNHTGGTIKTWTVDQTIQYMNAYKYTNCQMRNAALPIFNIKIKWVRDFIDEYSKLSLIKKCISPDGSNRDNHRQDQSILSILYYKYKDLYNFYDLNVVDGIQIHAHPNFKHPA